jgi:hypothetical protein
MQIPGANLHPLCGCLIAKVTDPILADSELSSFELLFPFAALLHHCGPHDCEYPSIFVYAAVSTVTVSRFSVKCGAYYEVGFALSYFQSALIISAV